MIRAINTQSEVIRPIYMSSERIASHSEVIRAIGSRSAWKVLGRAQWAAHSCRQETKTETGSGPARDRF